jgi:transcriptional regulator with XRE-family HTH domain
MFQQAALAEYVLNRRTKLGHSQTKLAKLAGISSGWIGRLESGALEGVPKPTTLRKLAKALLVPAKELFVAAGIEPITLEDMGVFVLTTAGGRERFIELAQQRAFPPTEEEIDLIRSIPDGGSEVAKSLRVEAFDEPFGDREWARQSLLGMIGGVEGRPIESRSDREIWGLIELLNDLPEERKNRYLHLIKSQIETLRGQ